MTLILTLGNNDNVVQVSDRRLSCDGKLIDDESNKCGTIICLNARLAFGYTGLARWKRFSTFDWLLDALHHSAAPEFTIGEILERLKIKANETFQNDQRLKYASKINKRLAIMFSGYINVNGYFKPGCTILSNYHNFQNNIAFNEAQDNFEIHYSSAREGVDNPTLIQRVVNWHAITNSDLNALREFLAKGKPSHAIRDKAFDFIRNIADRKESNGTIGKQLTSITIPKDLHEPVNSQYSSNIVKPETYMPSHVMLLPEQHYTVSNISVRPVENDTPPISVPKVGRNVPCPCGSQKKYKFCHGENRR